MNLVEVCRDYLNKLITKEELQEKVKEIEIFRPILATNELEESIFFNGNKNSWFEVKEDLKLTGRELRELLDLTNERI